MHLPGQTADHVCFAHTWSWSPVLEAATASDRDTIFDSKRERQNDVGEGAFHEIWLDALIVNNLRDYNTEREGDRVLQNQRKGIEVPMPGARTPF